MSGRVPRFNPPPRAPSKIGNVAGITDRNIAKGEAVEVRPGGGETRTQASTYFTKAQQVGQDVPILYNGDRTWVQLTLILQTAGPVAVGTSSNIVPVLSGKGVLLTTNVPFQITIAKGSRLYIASTGVNRVLVLLEPLPWLEQIAANLSQVRVASGK